MQAVGQYKLKVEAQAPVTSDRNRKYMITFQIAGYLTEFTGGRAEIKFETTAGKVGEALDQLWSRHVGLRDRVLTEQGEVRPHVNVFVNSQVVRRDQVLQTPLESDSEICIMPAVSGGFMDIRE